MSAVLSLQVPGYEDSDDEHPEPSTPPLSNPQADHKLLTPQYDSLDELVDDLHEWAAQADTVMTSCTVRLWEPHISNAGHSCSLP